MLYGILSKREVRWRQKRRRVVDLERATATGRVEDLERKIEIERQKLEEAVME